MEPELIACSGFAAQGQNQTFSDVSGHSNCYRRPNGPGPATLRHPETSGDAIRPEEAGTPVQISFLRGQKYCANRGLIHFKPMLTTVNLKSEKSSTASRVYQAKAEMQTCLQTLAALQSKESV